MRRALLIVVVLLSAVVPAGAEDVFTPNLVNQRVWFACGEQKVENADDNVATWDGVAPTASATTGAGCGTVDLPFIQTAPGNMYDATWTGTFTGNLDTLTAELHNIYVGPGRATGKLGVDVQLFVDGTPMFEELGRHADLAAVRSSSGLSEMVKFSINNIGYVTEDQNIEHDVTLLMHGGTAQNRGPTVTDTLSGWVWDTTEVPSGITFNPPALESTVLTVTPPATTP